MPAFTRQLESIANSSDDPDTQIACIIWRDGSESTVYSANQLPTRIKLTTECVTRPRKYSYIMHAELRAICLAANSGFMTRGSSMQLNWFPCATCAAAIIQAGIKTLLVDKKAYETRKDDPRYDFALAMNLLVEANVEITWLGETK